MKQTEPAWLCHVLSFTQHAIVTYHFRIKSFTKLGATPSYIPSEGLESRQAKDHFVTVLDKVQKFAVGELDRHVPHTSWPFPVSSWNPWLIRCSFSSVLSGFVVYRTTICTVDHSALLVRLAPGQSLGAETFPPP